MKKILFLAFSIVLLVTVFSSHAQTKCETTDAGGIWADAGTWRDANDPTQPCPCENGYPGSTVVTGETDCPATAVIRQNTEVIIGQDTDVYYNGILVINGTLTFNSGNSGGPQAGQLIMDETSDIFISSTASIQALGNNTNQTNNNYITLGTTTVNGSNINTIDDQPKPNQLTQDNLGGGGCSADGSCDADLGDQIGALPIELKSFEALKSGKNISLVWVTAKEENFSHFEIERSIDQDNWSQIGLVQGLGESMSDVNYDFTDRNAPFGVIYYRLKSVDIDATFEYSPVVKIEVGFEGKLAVSPNPVKDASNLKIQVPSEFREDLAYVGLFDLSGLKVQEFRNFNTDGSLQINQKLKSGMYILKVNHNGLQENIRVVIQ
ncbi:T9SS type A sorting domain-containing protein [Marivirga salinae]|uniref:T9SS type A sorting domain-containing protein n=1 Tax=Marivirga salinarum TaxID=3059078 RepID=A0AA51ND34_9BACT|nr:T9SS type A sorting domain-containing protein [Marivirga sp. BDSF4-3]WMN12920.1 T9SS type A sorting domain-containing protein [Marivirga sp. BDSF4-3]